MQTFVHTSAMSQKIPSLLLTAVCLGYLASTPILPATASEALLGLQGGLQACIETSQAKACRQAEARVKALTRNPAYPRASHLCKEEIGELAQLVALLPMQDAVPNELMASVADVQQACMPYGF